MILPILIIILMAGGILAGVASKWSSSLPRWISLIAVMIDFLLSIKICFDHDASTLLTNSSRLPS